jgi:hypothetical protein
MAKNLQAMRYGVIVPHGLWKHGISPKAIGLLCVILGLADIPDWEFSVKGLAALFDECEEHGSGINAIETGIAELEAARLLIRSRVRRDDGTLGSAEWLVSPVPMAEGIEDAPIGVSPVLDFPGQVEPAPITDFPGQAGRPQYKKPRREEEKPPMTPLEPMGEGENTGLPKLGRTRLRPSDLPESLAPVAERLALWWNTAKGGSKNQNAEQIEKAILAKEERGKGWQSITYSNWVEYASSQTRQRLQERARASRPTQEQEDIFDVIRRYPDLFAEAGMNSEGRVWLRFTDEARHAASFITHSRYPEETTATTVEAIQAEVDFLRHAMDPLAHGLDKSPCPF